MSLIEFLEQQKKEPYMQELQSFIKSKLKTSVIYPDIKDVFNAYQTCNWNDLRVVIVGIEPYADGYADGLAYSRTPDKMNMTIENVFREIWSDDKQYTMELANASAIPTYSFKTHTVFPTTNLNCWQEQGVLLLNILLTTETGNLDHKNKGWETLIKNTLRFISSEKENIVFMLWGDVPQKLESCINPLKHLILKAQHPSLAEEKGWFGNRHFSTANKYMIEKKKPLKQIRWWTLPN